MKKKRNKIKINDVVYHHGDFGNFKEDYYLIRRYKNCFKLITPNIGNNHRFNEPSQSLEKWNKNMGATVLFNWNNIPKNQRKAMSLAFKSADINTIKFAIDICKSFKK